MSDDDARETPIGTPSPSSYEDDADFAEEHTATTVDDDVTDGDEDDAETESPRGLGGMDTPPNPLREV